MKADEPVALVTGANKGIGLQIAKELAARGFAVLVGSRTLEAGENATKSVGQDACALQLDVTKQASIAAAAERIRKELGRLDVLVNNAGISHVGIAGRPLEEVAKSGLLTVAPLDDVRRIFETNVFGLIAVTQAMLALLLEAPAGRIDLRSVEAEQRHSAAQLKARMQVLHDEMNSLIRGHNAGAGQDEDGPALLHNPD